MSYHRASKKARKEADERYSHFLGMSIGKATRMLERSIILKLAQKCGMDNCFSCKEKILTIEDLSIEHKKPWYKKSVELFFDLDNIAFSHRKCNRPYERMGKKIVKLVEYPEGKAWCSSCQKFRDKEEFHVNKSRWNGLSSRCKSCSTIHNKKIYSERKAKELQVQI